MDTLSIIEHLMKKNDCKNKDLAEALGRDAQLVTDWRNKKSSSYRKYLPQIADYFGVTVDYLLGKDVSISAEEESNEKRELLNRIGQMDDDQLRQLSDFADYLIDKKK